MGTDSALYASHDDSTHSAILEMTERTRMTPRARETLFAHLVAQSPAMREVVNTAEKAAQTDANVYIYGENGTGKELMARAIHYCGARRGRPLVTLDCTAIPEGLMESPLFGHVRGAFTGAVETQEGVFSVAHTGTLFIDEIGELSLPLQSKLLRVLQFREFTQVGGSQARQVDVRFITATNRDLRQGVAAGTFRSDLYYRIGVIHIVIPPLRERREDIPLLVNHFLKKFAVQYARPVRRLTPRALDLVVHHDWPGNVRQLENCIEQGVIFGQGEALDVRDFRGVLVDVPAPEPIPPAPRPGTATPVPAEMPHPAALHGFFGKSLEELEEWYILETLKRFSGNRTRTARFIGLSLRSLQYKLKAYQQKRQALGPLTPQNSS
jgi:DNA-binding NtrC family response regulator